MSRKTLFALILSVMPTVNSALGAEPPASGTLQFEVTPLIGYRLGGNLRLIDNDQTVSVADHASLGIAFDVAGADRTQYELIYDRQSTTLTGISPAPARISVEYLHIGRLVALNETLHLRPYLAGALGLTRLTANSAPGGDDTRISISLALGLRLPVSRHFNLRFEGRGFLTPINTDSAVFCRSDQSGALCEVRAHGSLFFQFGFLAGAAYAF